MIISNYNILILKLQLACYIIIVLIKILCTLSDKISKFERSMVIGIGNVPQKSIPYKVIHHCYSNP